MEKVTLSHNGFRCFLLMSACKIIIIFCWVPYAGGERKAGSVRRIPTTVCRLLVATALLRGSLAIMPHQLAKYLGHGYIITIINIIDNTAQVSFGILCTVLRTLPDNFH